MPVFIKVLFDDWLDKKTPQLSLIIFWTAANIPAIRRQINNVFDLIIIPVFTEQRLNPIRNNAGEPRAIKGGFLASTEKRQSGKYTLLNG